MALIIAVTASMLYLAFAIEKKEMLELSHNGGTACFSRYSCKGLDILAARLSGSAFKVHILGITTKKPELIGTLKHNMEKYAAAAFQDRINLYASDGKLTAQYWPEDKGNKVISCCISDIDGDSNP